MAKRVSARCASCGRKGRPKSGSEYVCKRCRDGRAPRRRVAPAIEVEDRTDQQDRIDQRLSANRHHALANIKEISTMPSKRQPRKGISVKGSTMERLKDYCREHGLSVGGYVEDLANEKLDQAGAPRVRPEDLREDLCAEVVKPYERDWDLPLLL